MGVDRPRDARPDQQALEAAAAWAARVGASGDDPAVLAGLQAWRRADPRHDAAWRLAAEAWALGGSVRPAPRAVGRRRVVLGAAAAASAAALAVGLDLPVTLRSDHRTAIGERRSLALANGHTLHLNTDTAIALAEGEVLRVDLLRGEVLAEATDSRHPLQLRSPAVSAAVAGGAVALRLGGAADATVTATAGRIAAWVPAPSRAERMLGAGQQVDVVAGAFSSARPVAAETATAWRRGRLVVQDWPLERLVAELDRYHHGRIFLRSGAGSGRRVEGVFDIDDPLSAIPVLERAFGLTATRLTRLVTILHG
ncbi:hypothetical protein STVA_07110 [Allostella vacuolata]|nr:hypothetical protein STVA_07110 [Stella vacuolata]